MPFFFKINMKFQLLRHGFLSLHCAWEGGRGVGGDLILRLLAHSSRFTISVSSARSLSRRGRLNEILPMHCPWEGGWRVGGYFLHYCLSNEGSHCTWTYPQHLFQRWNASENPQCENKTLIDFPLAVSRCSVENGNHCTSNRSLISELIFDLSAPTQSPSSLARSSHADGAGSGRRSGWEFSNAVSR